MYNKTLIAENAKYPELFYQLLFGFPISSMPYIPSTPTQNNAIAWDRTFTRERILTVEANSSTYPINKANYLYFDGSDDIAFLYNVFPNTSQFSISMWVHVLSWPGSFPQLSDLYCYTNLSLAYGIDFRFGDGTDGNKNTLEVVIGATGLSNWQECISNVRVQLNQWTHIGITYKSGVVKFFRNGKIEEIQTGKTDPVYSSMPNRAGVGGSELNLPRYFNGYIDDYLIYNRELSPKEISILGSGRGNWLEKRNIEHFAFGGAGPVTDSYTLSEGIKAGDSFTVLQTIQKTLSEGILAGDSWATLQQINKTLSEGIAAGDTWAINLVRLASLTEGASIGDTWSILQQINKLFSEGASIGDTWATEVIPVGQQSYTLSEGIKAGDTWSFLQTILKTLAEGAKVGDSWSALQTILKTLSEGTVVSDAWIALQQINKTLSDGVKLGDTWSTATVTGAVVLSEGAKLGDTWGIKQTINKLFSEGIKGGDTWQALSSGYNIVYTSIVFYAAVKLKSVRFDPVT